jgi:hypothetical protein
MGGARVATEKVVMPRKARARKRGGLFGDDKRERRRRRETGLGIGDWLVAGEYENNDRDDDSNAAQRT